MKVLRGRITNKIDSFRRPLMSGEWSGSADSITDDEACVGSSGFSCGVVEYQK
jgi:hypothetical protein